MSFTGLRRLCHIPMIGSSILSSLGSQIKFPFLVEQVRTSVKKPFYRPSERKRVNTYGWKVRLKTPGGRAIIMRRILKGRFVLSH